MSIPRGVEIAGKCGARESELHISWINRAFTFRIFFSKVSLVFPLFTRIMSCINRVSVKRFYTHKYGQ